MEPPQYYVSAPDTRQRVPSIPGLPDQQGNGDGTSDSPFTGMNAQLGQMVWEAGSKSVQDTFKSYGRIDFFRPYFDVDPSEVRARLIRSFIPRKPSQMATSPDLYGPSMVVLTMVALLLFNMKTSGFVVQSGTLMGTAMFTSFASWIFLSGLMYLCCFLLAAEVPMLQIASIFGYSLTSQCLVLLLTSLLHTSHDHVYFFLLVGLFCVPSAVRMGLLLCMHARMPSHRLALCASAVVVHTLLILYLHFGFHVMVEEIDSMMEGGGAAENVIKGSIPISE